MLLLKESDSPKSIRDKIAEYVGRPPQPILKFYKDFRIQPADDGKHLLFAVRNGLPLPLLYGIYIETDTEYIEKTDHIGPWSVDDWRLTIENVETKQVSIRVGVLPFEILTDRATIDVSSTS